MGVAMPRCRGFLCLVSFLLPLCLGPVAAGGDLNLDRTVNLPPGDSVVVEVPRALLEGEESASVAISASVAPRTSREQVLVRIVGTQPAPIARKQLHPADTEFFVLLQPRSVRAVELQNTGEVACEVDVHVRRVGPWADSSRYRAEQEPNNSPDTANAYSPGMTLVGGAASEPYRPAQDLRSHAWDASDIDQDWFRFEWNRERAALAYFWIDILDREVPVDVTLYELRGEELKPVDPKFEKFQPERSTEYVGLFKFVARKLLPGRTYLLRIRARHPFYILRSQVYELPPYLRTDGPVDDEIVREAARRAVRVAQDYVLLKGEAWHANTPRTGAVANRWQNVHAETAQCIACHPTQFSTRGALFSIANGYPVERRLQLDFLADRMYNNPRPFYGFPEAAWTRVISAAANSVSRPSVLLRLYEDHVSGRSIPAFHQAAAHYLRLYYDGRDRLPRDESNGNRPLVSAFEVALHSWQVFQRLADETGDKRWQRLADQVEQLIVQAPDDAVEDMLDLCYQTLAFCRIDRNRYRDRIEANVARILSLQREDGRWGMKFREQDPPCEFQTAHCVYVLAVAGLPATHPAIRKAVVYLLRHQEPFGAWYDDEDPSHPHPYENFQTPFRETQFALMALSELYPGPAKGGRVSTGAVGNDWTGKVAVLTTASQHREETCRLVRDAARSPDPIIRSLAAIAIGRDLHCGTELLPALLRDPEWIVRRAAAWSLRRVVNYGLAAPELGEFLDAPDSRLRRDALQVLQYHFRFWVTNERLLRRLVAIVREDPDPICRVLASRSLWQWWYWTPDEGSKSLIEDALLAALMSEREPAVVRNLQEAVYNVCDENVRYLYNNWIPRLAQPQWRAKATAAQRQTAARQAKKLAARLEEASPEQAQRLLAAVGWFHLRGPVEGRGRERRIGNDVETVRFYPPAAELFARQVKRFLASPDPKVRVSALLGALAVRDTSARTLVAPAVLRLVADSDRRVRALAVRHAERFVPGIGQANSLEAAETVQVLLTVDDPEANRLALKFAGELDLEGDARSRIAMAVRSRLRKSGQPSAELLGVLRSLPEMLEDREVLRAVRRAFRARSRAVRVEATRVVLSSVALANSELFRRPLEQTLADARSDPELAKALLRALAVEKEARRGAFLAVLTAESLQAQDSTVRAAALDVLRKVPGLRQNAAVRRALERLARSDAGLAAQVAEALYRGQDVAALVNRRNRSVEELLDFEFFRRRVQPIFYRKGRDGQACADCHLNHGLLNLVAPGEGVSELEAARHNYESALRVIDLERPETSLLLQKPLSDASEEGVIGGKLPHGGGVRWPEGEASAEYRIILEWLNGARYEEPAAGN